MKCRFCGRKAVRISTSMYHLCQVCIVPGMKVVLASSQYEEAAARLAKHPFAASEGVEMDAKDLKIAVEAAFQATMSTAEFWARNPNSIPWKGSAKFPPFSIVWGEFSGPAGQEEVWNDEGRTRHSCLRIKIGRKTIARMVTS